MKILFLSKRRPQGKDLLTRPYGRFFYLPHHMHRRGHEVYTLLLSYKNEPSITVKRAGITWLSAGPLFYLKQVSRIIREVQPDWIVGFSDIYYGIMAQVLGERHGIGSAIDAYDNYESYLPWCKPLHACWRKALSRATVVTAAGPQLARYLRGFRADEKAFVVPMAADPGVFQPLDKGECRRKIGLPANKRIIGYCGSIARSRGIHVLFETYRMLAKADPELMLVVTGRKDKGVRIPFGAEWLGYLSDDIVPLVMNSLDVFLVINELSAFGNYSYPVKLYEAMQCRVPVVASDTPPARWILQNRSELLAIPQDPTDLARKITPLLELGRLHYGEQNTWEHSCAAFEEALSNKAKLL